MDQKKIGRFIAENRKLKKMTQVELAEKLGVSDRSVSKWENGRCMPDLSLFEPLCEELGITINEFLSGEKIKKEEYQEELEKNIVNTIDYSQKQVDGQKRKVSYILMITGMLISFSAFMLFSPENSWISLYSITGILVFISGVFRELRTKSMSKKLAVSVVSFVIILSLFYGIDFVSVSSFHRPPIYRYATVTEWEEPKVITYNSLFYDVYRVNPGTQNEYYIIDTQDEYDSDTLPVTPFNREKSGIDNIIKYKNKYIGNNSNTGNLLSDLPLSEYGFVFEIDSSNCGLTVDYHTTAWYQNENQYISKALIYNSISIFLLIDNVNDITFNFSGESYRIEKTTVEEKYPNYSEVLLDGEIDKDRFNEYVEDKMNDDSFVEKIFNKCSVTAANHDSM